MRGTVKPQHGSEHLQKQGEKPQTWYVRRIAHSTLLNEGDDLKEQWETQRISKNGPLSGPKFKLDLNSNAGECLNVNGKVPVPLFLLFSLPKISYPISTYLNLHILHAPFLHF